MNKDAVAEMSQQYQVEAAEKLVPERYKQTEVGVIPEDWEVFSVGDAFEICNNLRLPLSAKVREKMAGVYPYYGPTRIQDFINEYRIEGEFALIGEDGDHFLKFDSVPQTQYVTGKFNVNNHAHLVKGKIGTAKWFYLFFRSRDITMHLTRQGAGRFKLNKASLEKILCSVPSTKEQTAIANALSDTDALLSELEKLIAKKQAIKTATMQQLLTGRTRLPQFAYHPDGSKKGYKQSELGEIPDDWEVVPLGKLASIKTGSKNNQDKVADGIYPFFVRSETVERLNSYSYDCEAILVPGEGGIGSIFHYINGKFDAHQRVYVIRQFVNCSGKYIYFQMRQHFGAHAMENSVKATVDSLRLPTFQEFSVFVSSLEEQTTIATILSDMDAEIQALEQRLNKTRQIKQGMMQELLTGKTRLLTAELSK